MNTKALYKHIYQMHRVSGKYDLEELARFMYFATLLGIDIADSRLRTIAAAGESFAMRALCDRYDGWMEDVRREVMARRIFSPIGQALISMLGERGLM